MAEISRTKRREEVDVSKIVELAGIGFTQDQICDYFGLGRAQLESNADWIDAWREGNIKFREAIIRGQFDVATDKEARGRDRMLLWLGKVHLGQREIQQVEATVNTSLEQLIAMSNKLDD